ncbi:MAG TPA: cupin domain-containing protein [Polyangiaceae bacterium]|nr:cupin domain-containing protein [Polyangiaceae bacterium]
MTESARLPRFVREALEGEADTNLTGDALADAASALEFERSLLALERALSGDDVGAKGAVPNADAALQGNGPGANVGPADADIERLFQRLDGTVNEPPHRYAPFFSRAAELFDLSEDVVIGEMTRLADPKAWTFAGLPGISHATIQGGPRVKSAETLFVRFKPGVYFPRHQHTGLERVLVLEGSYEDSHGVQHHPGELREWPSGTEHSFKVSDETCIFASVVFGRRFYAWPLRALAKLLGK